MIIIQKYYYQNQKIYQIKAIFHLCDSLKEFSRLKNKKYNIIKSEDNDKKEIYSETDNINKDSEEHSIVSSFLDIPTSKNDDDSILENFQENLCFIDSKNSEYNKYELTDISHMFEGSKSLLSIKDISEWNISKVTDVTSLFEECESLLSMPDISKWNTSNITNISNLFNSCSSLISLPDISKWDMSNVYNMSALFWGCSSLISLPDISKWNIKNCRDMNYLFD